MPAASVSVLAREPRPGLVKTRLCPPLDPVRAADLALAFATDTLAALAGMSRTAGGAGLDVRLALEGDGTGRLAGIAASLGIVVEGQGEGNLGARMAMVMGRALRGGLPSILVGTDAPDLPAAIVEAAVEALGRVDVVLSPARDGGYVLVGARRPVASLFRIDADWGGDRVFEATCAALRRERCAFEVLEAWEDVDDAAALGRLAVRLGGDRAAAAPSTARLLEEWRGRGVRF